VIQFTTANTKVAARCTFRTLGYVTAYFIFGILTSMAAALFGLFFVLFAGMGLDGAAAIVFIPFIPIVGFPIGFLLSMPITFVLLPALTLLLKHRPATHLFVLSLSGAIAGGCITSLWVGTTRQFSGISTELVAAGATAGLVAGIIYAAMVRGLRQ
jgi:hypothetical protein